MIRFLLSSFFFLLTFLFETSFLSSLPFPLPLTPFVFAMGVYLLQHQGLIEGFVWILAFGFLTQLLHTSILPLPALGFLVGGVVSLLSARHVFSNRSLYGVIACALAGFVAMVFVESGVLMARSFTGGSVINWFSSVVMHGYRILLLLIVISILYSLAKPIQRLLHR